MSHSHHNRSSAASVGDRPIIGISVGRLLGDGRLLDAISHEYAAAVSSLGGIPVLLPIMTDEQADDLVGMISGLILSGGGDVDPLLYEAPRDPATSGVDRARDLSEMAILHSCLERKIPVLGICRGFQLLNVALGGTLTQQLAMHPVQHLCLDRREVPTHAVHLSKESDFRTLMDRDTLQVNSIHHQGVDRLARGLTAVAFADDGVIEAYEDPQRQLVGVQWHPELIMKEPGSRELFSLVVHRASEFLNKRVEATS